MSRQSESDAEYFAKRVHKVSRVDGMTDCWEWTAGLRSGRGARYGAAFRNGRSTSAHRAAYEAFRGPIERGALVCHKCNNPPCCNPDHLYAGTYRDNAEDMKAHGVHRLRSPRRERHACAKLTDDSVAEIRALALTKATCAEIGARFGITAAQVSRITRDQSWASGAGAMSHRGRGEFNHMATLTTEQAQEIARRARAGGQTLKAIGVEFGVSEATVVRIRQGVHWAVRREETAMSNGEQGPP